MKCKVMHLRCVIAVEWRRFHGELNIVKQNLQFCCFIFVVLVSTTLFGRACVFDIDGREDCCKGTVSTVPRVPSFRQI